MIREAVTASRLRLTAYPTEPWSIHKHVYLFRESFVGAVTRKKRLVSILFWRTGILRKGRNKTLTWDRIVQFFKQPLSTFIGHNARGFALHDQMAVQSQDAAQKLGTTKVATKPVHT